MLHTVPFNVLQYKHKQTKSYTMVIITMIRKQVKPHVVCVG